MKDNCALIEQFMRSTELRKKYELVWPIRSKLYTKSDIIEQWKNFIENR
jgi:hypothetical protein